MNMSVGKKSLLYNELSILCGASSRQQKSQPCQVQNGLRLGVCDIEKKLYLDMFGDFFNNDILLSVLLCWYLNTVHSCSLWYSVCSVHISDELIFSFKFKLDFYL